MIAALTNGASLADVKESHDWRMAPSQVKAYVEAFADIQGGYTPSQSAGVRGAPVGRFEFVEPEEVAT